MTTSRQDDTPVAAERRRGKGGRRAKEPPIKADLPARERIMLEAEKLFAEHGLSAVSGRTIISEAKVNVAALHYYFGTKEQLLREIFEAKAKPIVEARERNLKACRDEPGRPPLLEQILEAFLRPCFVQSPDIETDVKQFALLRARLATEPEAVSCEILNQTFDKSSIQYLEALGRALPELSQQDLYWRFHFLLGTMVYTMANSGRIQALTDGRCDPGSDGEETVRHLVHFLAVGFRAPNLELGGNAK